MAAMAKILCSISVFAAWNALSDFCDLTQSDNMLLCCTCIWQYEKDEITVK